MVDAKSQVSRGSPSGPIGDRKQHGTIGGKGTTIAKNATTNITVTTTTIPGIAGVKPTDVIYAATDSSGPADANVRAISAYCTTANQVVVSFINPTGVDVTDYTVGINLLIFPFNI